MVAFKTDNRKTEVSSEQRHQRQRNVISHFVSHEEIDPEQEVIVPAWKAWLIISWISVSAVTYFVLLLRLIW